MKALVKALGALHAGQGRCTDAVDNPAKELSTLKSRFKAGFRLEVYPGKWLAFSNKIYSLLLHLTNT